MIKIRDRFLLYLFEDIGLQLFNLSIRLKDLGYWMFRIFTIRNKRNGYSLFMVYYTNKPDDLFSSKGEVCEFGISILFVFHIKIVLCDKREHYKYNSNGEKYLWIEPRKSKICIGQEK